MPPIDGLIPEEKLRDILLKGSYLGAEEFEAAQKIAADKKISLAEALIERGLLTRDLLGQSVAETFGVKYAEKDSVPTSRDQIQKIPEKVARDYRVIFISENPLLVTIASDKPLAENLLTELQKIFTGKEVTVQYALPETIDLALKLYEKPLAVRFAEMFESKSAFVPGVIDEIIEDAVHLNASDIHFEPREKETVIRFRIDGVLLEATRIPKKYYENILNRIKILAHLPIDEHFKAQDGSLRHTRNEGVVNIRVSIAPTLDGEKVALRLLSQYITSFTTDTLGLNTDDQKILMEAAKKPFGMILVTGPTGSGKTTTLYALLNSLNSSEINITTIEDPVEYKIEGINQMQTNPQTDLTFARGLRSIVRQDPDIVLVGEIRDSETAEIAVNAALTGHLLFSTFHANDAATTIPRLLDIGIEPFLLGSTLELIIAQRLVRKICGHCKISYTASTQEIEAKMPKASPYFKNQQEITLYRGKGCEACHFTGYLGRIAIFELIRNSSEMQELIAVRPAKSAVSELARKEGARSLFEDGLSKVKGGITTLEELLRVAAPES
jgi:type II secretory ATPase GspE/PulE/Tfp pilus assembly ATPase PilB-like protein